MTTPYERLMAETIPTRPAPAPSPAPPARPVEPWTAAEQDAHWAELCEAVGTPDAPRPHLHLITDETEAA
ncbi:hypothetical protein AB0D11_02285 [Streptomyces monashensis]|uniref:hypothetical protein n=1 Tax=Streptomyces monashensis TaxID=1678012 RepID=UPI0033F51884